jgi:hypothetical protein
MKSQGNLRQQFLLAAALLVVGAIGWLLYISAPDPSVWRITGYVVGLLFALTGIEWLALGLFRSVRPRTEPQSKAQRNLGQGFRFALVSLIVGAAGWILYISTPGFSIWRYAGLGAGWIFTLGGLLVLGIYLARTIQARG